MTVKFQGNPINLEGHQILVGEKIKTMRVVLNDLSEIDLKDIKGKKLILTVPSLDTPVCATETRKFNELVSKIPGLTTYVVSLDLPFAQSRWCGNEGIKNVISVSDYKYHAVAKKTGTLAKELGLLTRAVFIVDENNVVEYVNYLEEITSEPNYDEVIKALAA